MAFFKNAFVTIIFAVAFCLSLLMGVLLYLQQTMFQQNMDAQQRVAEILVSSLNDTSNTQAISIQLSNKLEQLPGWQAAIYNAEGQLQWQLGNLSLPSINVQQAQQGRVSVEVRGEEDWSVRSFPIKDNDPSLQKIITILVPLTPVQNQVQFMANLVLGVAVIVGFVLWLTIRHNSRSFKTEIRSYIRQHRKELNHDKLTGLLNREILLERMEYSFSRAQRNKNQVAVLYIGLDKFKEINEYFGHTAGDQVLRSFASRLSKESRASDTLVRMEGDEFVLLITDIHQRDEIELIADRIVKIFLLPVELGGKEYFVSASIGIAIESQFKTDSEVLLFNAYTAMKSVKKQGGGNRYQFFENAIPTEPGTGMPNKEEPVALN